MKYYTTWTMGHPGRTDGERSPEAPRRVIRQACEAASKRVRMYMRIYSDGSASGWGEYPDSDTTDYPPGTFPPPVRPGGSLTTR